MVEPNRRAAKSIGEEGTFDSENQQEEDCKKLPTTFAKCFLAATQHYGQIAKQEHDNKQGDGRFPRFVGEWNTEPQSKTHKEGVDGCGYCQGQHHRPAGDVEGGTFFFAERREKHADTNYQHETQIEKVVVFG